MHGEVVIGKVTGKEYDPLKFNELIYTYLQQISIEKDRESAAKKEISAHIAFVEKELELGKGSFKEWVSLKLAEINKGLKLKEAAVELDRQLKTNRETFGKSSDLEERIERIGTMSVQEAYEAGLLKEDNSDDNDDER